MANLEAKSYMSAWQLAIVVFVTCVGAQIMLSPRGLVAQAGHGAWISVIFGGVIFYLAVYLMLTLGKAYPEETLIEYAPRLFGRVGGTIVICWFNLLFFLQVTEILAGVGRILAFYMFARTPSEVLILALLVVCTYCALQDWGTILRVQQFMFFVAYSMLTMVWMVSMLNLRPENLLPLWPKDIKGVIGGGFSTWSMYSGYECVLLLLPLVYRQTTFGKLAKTVGTAFGCLSLLFLLVIILIIGVLTVKTAQNVPYPALLVIRSVELPGTFIERLENYLLLAWIPVVFDTLAAMIFFMGQVCMRQWRYADHRPWVLFFVPILYITSILLDNPQVIDMAGKYTMWVGVLFSFVVVPAALLLSWWQKRKGGAGCG
jgi:spore germination protein